MFFIIYMCVLCNIWITHIWETFIFIQNSNLIGYPIFYLAIIHRELQRAQDGCLHIQWVLLQEMKPELRWSLSWFHSERNGCSLGRDVTLFLNTAPRKKTETKIKTKKTWKMNQVKIDQGLAFFVYSARVCRNSQGPQWTVSPTVLKAVTETSLISSLKDYLDTAL